MRYKATPLAVRNTPPTPSPGRSAARTASAWVALLAVALLVPSLLLPADSARAAGPALGLSPSSAAAGTSVRVSGSGLPAKVQGQLAFDGSTSGMPTFRTDASGSFAASITVPPSSVGSHSVEALSRSTGSRASAVLVSATLQVVTASATSTPAPTPTPTPIATLPATPAPTATPTPAPTATPTPAPTATPTPAPSATDRQPSFPIRAAFYYPWFPEAWNQQGMDPFTHYHPSLGYYDGSSSAVIASQIRAMQYGGLQAGIASWWGQGSRTDGRLPLLLAGAAGTGFRWSVYYEAEGTSDPTVSQIASDLTYIVGRYGADPSYLRIAGRPVVFVYGGATDGCSMVDRWRQANAGIGAYTVLKVFTGYKTCASQPDGWHQYGPAVAESNQSPYSFTISPGFWKANETSPRLARDLARWTQDIAAMVASNARFELVTTFNEWGEGTAVESASEWASGSGYGTYLDALHAALGTAPAP